jgi:F-type H+-transporting ATPase subunit b
VIHVFTTFAAETHQTAEPAGGIAALGLNWQAFLFQLITFVIVLVILRQFVYKKLVATLESRRQTVEDSLKHAAETEAKLKQTEQTIAGMLAEARLQADEVVSVSHKEASQLVEAAESKAVQRAEHIVKSAQSQIDVEVTKARQALRAETAQLVASATEKIIKEKIDPAKDARLIAEALQSAKEKK